MVQPDYINFGSFMRKLWWWTDMAYEYKEYNFNKDIKKIIALNIRKFRKEKGYTQEQLALYTDRSFEFIRRIESEKGRRGFSVETLWRIATVLEVPLDKFFEE